MIFCDFASFSVFTYTLQCWQIMRKIVDHMLYNKVIVEKQIGRGRPTRLISIANAITLVREFPARTSVERRESFCVILQRIADGDRRYFLAFISFLQCFVRISFCFVLHVSECFFVQFHPPCGGPRSQGSGFRQRVRVGAL